MIATPEHAVARGAAAVQRPLPRDAHQQPAAATAAGRTSRSRAGARTRPATPGAASATCATPRRGTFWSTAHQPTQGAAGQLRGDLLARAAPSSAAATRASTRTPRSSSRPRTTSSCGALRLTNRSRARRSIELTSYAEVVLAPAAADAAHPAFSKLFVQTEMLDAAGADPVHAPAALGRGAAAVDVPPRRGARRAGAGRRRTRPTARASSAAAAARTRRRRCVTRRRCRTRGLGARPGRGDPPRDHARARADGARRHRLRRGRHARGLPRAGAQVRWTGAWPTGCSSSPGRTARSCCASSTPARPMRSSTRASPAPSSTRSRRCAPTPSVLLRNRRGQSGLWGYAISGDLPIVLLQISDAGSIELVRQLVQAHAWWRLKGLAVDLVIWNEERDVYRQRLQEQILGLIVEQPRSARGRPARRHLRAPRRADRRTRTACCCRRWRARSSATAAARSPSRWRARRGRRAPAAARSQTDALRPSPRVASAAA